MALTSPGVQVTVIDESQYIPSAVNTVPYFLIATAQNKADAAGVGVAAGTTAANANKTYLITSQRDLAATFGVPFFYNTTTGTPINGYELNEYGLLAAYSALGVTNRAYVQRVDIDLTQLTASLSRPIGTPNNGTYWLDTSTSNWGIFEWNQTTGQFTNMTPILVTDTNNVVDYAGGDYTPLTTVGSIGDYAVSAVSLNNQIYYKNSDNVWVWVGSDAWKTSYPTIQGTVSNPVLTTGRNMYINGHLVAVPGTATVSAFSAAINTALPYGTYGFYTEVIGGKLTFMADSTASNDGSTENGGVVSIEPGPNGGTALLTALGITATEYRTPNYFAGYSYQAPRWGTGQYQPAPTGSVWQNVSAVNNGLSLKVKKYSAALATFVPQTSPAYFSDVQANYGLDPSGGGKNIAVGSTYVQYDSLHYDYAPNASAAFLLLERIALGATVVTGDVESPTFTSGDQFQVESSQAGQNYTNLNTVTLSGTTPAAFVSSVSAANIPYVSASVNSSGAIVFTHSQGGVIALTDLSGGSAVVDAGFIAGTTPNCRQSSTAADQVVLSNWVTADQFTYTASGTTPDQNPADGRLWYYSSVDDVDIMIQNNGSWVGYQTVSNDTRGFNLTQTNASGPIVAATAPTTQNNTALSPLVYGDLWVDTSDLENYPKLYRWAPVDGMAQWVLTDNTDQVSSNGILFADARWSTSGATNPVSDPLPSITSLLTSNHLDLDAPDPALYPQGMLLWNTRRSGYNIKAFTTNYFTSAKYPDAGTYNPAAPTNNANLPEYSYTWVTASGFKADGSMYAGRQAQRALIVKAMKSGIDTSLAAREEQNQFNLIAATAYPELLPNLVALSNERANTLFCVGDTPMRLAGNGTDLATYATNNGGLGLPTGDGLTVGSAYAAVFYPSCQTTDLSGNLVVTAPSHMMVRTMLRSDAVSYPWFAPAGTRRGVVDNATTIGYINGATGEFVQIAVSQGLRDVLYQNNINPITFIPGIGITNFGNKTRQGATTALDRINVARLICFLRGRLEEIGKLYLFEPNDQITRNQITNTVNSLMIDLVAKRALYDYLVVCDLSNNTPARIDRNELWVDVAIEPVKAVEFIYIPLRIKNTGGIAAGV
jgi:Phage tail sheath C-terminal domain